MEKKHSREKLKHSSSAHTARHFSLPFHFSPFELPFSLYVELIYHKTIHRKKYTVKICVEDESRNTRWRRRNITFYDISSTPLLSFSSTKFNSSSSFISPVVVIIACLFIIKFYVPSLFVFFLLLALTSMLSSSLLPLSLLGGKMVNRWL